MLHELEQPVLGVLGVVDDDDDRRGPVADPLEEGRPRGEQVLLGVVVGGEAEEDLEARRHPLPFVTAHAVLVQGRREQCGLLLVGVIGVGRQPAAHRLGHGPEGHPLSVGEAPPGVPLHRVGEPVDVLLELPGEPGLPDAGLPVDEQQGRSTRRHRRVEQLLGQAQLAVPADVRCLETVRALGATRAATTLGAPQRQRLGLALQRVGAGIDVGDGGGGQQPGRVVDPHLTGLGERLHPRRRVHGITGDHALVHRSDGDGDLAGHDADRAAPDRRHPWSSPRLATR